MIWRFSRVLGCLTLVVSAETVMAKPTNAQLTIGVTQEFSNLNRMVNSLTATSYIQQMVVHPLIAIDEKWEWQCFLCKEIPTIDNGKARIIEDGGVKKLLVDWEIKAEANWGDGTPVTGNDVLLSWQVGNDVNVSTPEKDMYQKIESISVDEKDPKKFTMKFKEARYDFFQLGTYVILPSHLEKATYEKTKGQTEAYEKQTQYNTDPTNKGLYNGPYLVKEIKLGSHVIVERNPNYYGKKPAIDRIIIKLIPNTQTLEANLLSGTIDMIGELGMTFDQAIAFEKRIAADPALQAKLKIEFKSSMTYEHIDLNLRNPVLTDVNVRKALVYGIDRKKLTEALFENRQGAAISNMHPLDVYYTEKLETYAYDPKKAEKLLNESGWVKGKDGIRERDGKKLELTLMTTAQNKARELVQVWLQQEWKKIGIKVDIQNEPARVFFGETVRKGRYSAMAMYAWVSSPDSPPRSTLHSKEIPTAENGYSGQNSGGWRNKTVDELLTAIYTEFDVKKRQEMMQRVQEEYTSEIPVIPLYWRADIAVIPANLEGFALTGHQFSSTLSVDRWKLNGSSGQGE